jgi:hypothetical protein
VNHARCMAGRVTANKRPARGRGACGRCETSRRIAWRGSRRTMEGVHAAGKHEENKRRRLHGRAWRSLGATIEDGAQRSAWLVGLTRYW